jgi:hypothetical protein
MESVEDQIRMLASDDTKVLKIYTDLNKVRDTLYLDKSDFFNIDGGDDSYNDFAKWIVMSSYTEEYLDNPLSTKLYEKFIEENRPELWGFVYFNSDGTIEWENIENDFGLDFVQEINEIKGGFTKSATKM